MECRTMIVLENDHISVGVKTIGAELCSVKGKKRDIEYLWQADPAFWGRHSCILFPIIGKLKNDHYTLGEKNYQISQHGFVRDMPFEIFLQETDTLSMKMCSDAQTFEKFPFHFEVIISYRLVENCAEIEYSIINNSTGVMPYSLGAHPAFNCPLDKNLERKDYSLRFDATEKAYSRCLDHDGLIDNRRKLILDNEDIIHLADDLFDEDALIFQDLNSQNVTLIDYRGDKIWTFNFSGFPYLGIWSQKGCAPFVCIEPWHGIADTSDATGQIFEKEGIRTLGSKNSFSCLHSITIH